VRLSLPATRPSSWVHGLGPGGGGVKLGGVAIEIGFAVGALAPTFLRSSAPEQMTLTCTADVFDELLRDKSTRSRALHLFVSAWVM